MITRPREWLALSCHVTLPARRLTAWPWTRSELPAAGGWTEGFNTPKLNREWHRGGFKQYYTEIHLSAVERVREREREGELKYWYNCPADTYPISGLISSISLAQLRDSSNLSPGSNFAEDMLSVAITLRIVGGYRAVYLTYFKSSACVSWWT